MCHDVCGATVEDVAPIVDGSGVFSHVGKNEDWDAEDDPFENVSTSFIKIASRTSPSLGNAIFETIKKNVKI